MFLALSKDSINIGVEAITSSAYTPQSNNLAERISSILLHKVPAMLSKALRDAKFYEEALHQDAYKYYRAVTIALKMNARLETLLVVTPNSCKLKVFGSASTLY